MRTGRLTTALIALPFAALLSADDASAQWRVVRPQGQQQAIRYADMDANGDGVITRSEWQGTRQSFNSADWNGDGVLSGDEVRLENVDVDDRAVGTTGTARARRLEFQDLDENDDGIINRAEWTGTRALFNRQDLNGDGVITRREYVGFEANSAQGASGRQVQNGQNGQIIVDSQNRWTDTGITVNAGDIIVFNAQGSVQLSENGNDSASVAGAQSGRRAAEAPIPDALAGALIGRIGNSAPFGIGNQRQITAPASGVLFLGVNDDYLEDNRGSFRVRLSVR